MRLTDLLDEARILPSMRSSSKDEALSELAGLIASGTSGLTPADLERVLREREDQGSTGIGAEVAIPHGRLAGPDRVVVGLGRSPDGVEFDSADGRPARLFFVVLACGSSSQTHLGVLARISRICRDPAVMDRLLAARDSREMLEEIDRADLP